MLNYMDTKNRGKIEAIHYGALGSSIGRPDKGNRPRIDPGVKNHLSSLQLSIVCQDSLLPQLGKKLMNNI